MRQPIPLSTTLAALSRHTEAAWLASDGHSGCGHFFADPRGRILAHRPGQIRQALAQIEEERQRGHLVGWFGYEAGYPLDSACADLCLDGDPLLDLGVFDEPADPDGEEFERGAYHLTTPRPEIGFEDYRRAIRIILESIRQGDVYQVNYTFRLRFRLMGDPRALFADLHQAQPTGMSAILRHGDDWVLSLSPELFLEQQGQRIAVQPMKGTAAPSSSARETRSRGAALCSDEKNKAENLMIVDLMRNDLGRIAETGSVAVSRLFEVVQLPSVLQMVSGVEARLKAGVGVGEVFRALFPSGSVTGAPKIAAMRCIRRLEGSLRSVYCGAVGILGPGVARLNVAIRTIRLRKVPASGRGVWGVYDGEMGIGSGIVADSRADDEWSECLLKAAFLERCLNNVGLIETMRSQAPEAEIDAHLRRMAASADYFEMPIDRSKLRQAIVQAASSSPAGGKLRAVVRNGDLALESLPAEAPLLPVGIAFSERRIDADNLFRYHKTTVRGLYDRTLRAAISEGLWDVVFCNRAGEVAEGCRSNLFVRIGDRWWTPPIACGILPGLMRAQAIARLDAAERILRPSDVASADGILLTNAVHGLLPATLQSQQVRFPPA